MLAFYIGVNFTLCWLHFWQHLCNSLKSLHPEPFHPKHWEDVFDASLLPLTHIFPGYVWERVYVLLILVGQTMVPFLTLNSKYLVKAIGLLVE